MKEVNGLARHQSSFSSVVRAFQRFTEGHFARSLSGTQMVSLPHARDSMNITSLEGFNKMPDPSVAQRELLCFVAISSTPKHLFFYLLL